MKEFLGCFIDVVVLEIHEYDPEDKFQTVYWDKSLVPVGVHEKWMIARKGTKELQEAFREIQRSDPYFHQKIGEALYYQDNSIRDWCQKYRHPYVNRSEL